MGRGGSRPVSGRVYFDSSALVKLYIVEPGSEDVQVRSKQADEIILCPLQETEVRNAILAAGGRGILNRTTMLKTLKNLESDLAQGFYERYQPEWPLIWNRSNELAVRHTPEILCRTLDILHVAIAEISGCACFVTGDERQFRLSQAIGLDAKRI